jgi:hypothetical protein
MAYAMHILSYVLLMIALAMLADLLRVPPRWIGVGVVVLAAFGILSALTVPNEQRD